MRLPGVTLSDDYFGTITARPEARYGEALVNLSLDHYGQNQSMTTDDARALAMVLLCMADAADNAVR